MRFVKKFLPVIVVLGILVVLLVFFAMSKVRDGDDVVGVPGQDAGSDLDCAAVISGFFADFRPLGGSEIKTGDRVVVDYVGTTDDGQVFDSSVERVLAACAPERAGRGVQGLEFVVGQGQLLPGFETAVLGKTVGSVVELRLEAAEAYGERDAEKLVRVAKAEIPNVDQYSVGQQLLGEFGQVFTVYRVEPEVVVFDTNHPLAGEPLNFQIVVREVN